MRIDAQVVFQIDICGSDGLLYIIAYSCAAAQSLPVVDGQLIQFSMTLVVCFYVVEIAFTGT